MQLQRIGKRGLLFSFNDPYFTNVYVIISDERIFILDTFLGSDPMNQIKDQLIHEGYLDWQIFVFNSHADYDHIWGNRAANADIIIGHENCRKRIMDEGEKSLETYAEHKRGEVVIYPPNITFTTKLFFPYDKIEFFYSPGHTIDSSSCYDAIDKVLFVGDNVESPIPYLNHANFEEYLNTLNNYLMMDWKFIVAGHDSILTDSKLITQNIEYLTDFRDWKLEPSSMDSVTRHRHINHNLSTIKDELLLGKQKKQARQHLEDIEKFSH